MYETVPLQAEAIQWTGENSSSVIAFTGEKNVTTDGRKFQVYNGEYWTDLAPGWWVLRYQDGSLGVLSPGAFRRYWTTAAE